MMKLRLLSLFLLIGLQQVSAAITSEEVCIMAQVYEEIPADELLIEDLEQFYTDVTSLSPHIQNHLSVHCAHYKAFVVPIDINQLADVEFRDLLRENAEVEDQILDIDLLDKTGTFFNYTMGAGITKWVATKATRGGVISFIGFTGTVGLVVMATWTGGQLIYNGIRYFGFKGFGYEVIGLKERRENAQADINLMMADAYIRKRLMNQ